MPTDKDIIQKQLDLPLPMNWKTIMVKRFLEDVEKRLWTKPKTEKENIDCQLTAT